MFVAPCARMGQRMLEQRQQCRRIQLPYKQRCDVAQQPARRGQLEGSAGAVVRQDVPPVQCGRDLTGQHPVGRDQCGGLPVCNGLAQTHRDGQRFDPGGWCLNQCDISGRQIKIGQLWSLGQPRMCHWRRPHRERDQLVARRRRGRRIGPIRHRIAWQIQRLHQMAKAVLRMIL